MHQWWSEVGDSRNVIVGATKLKKRELIAPERSEFSPSPDFCVINREFYSTTIWLRKYRTSNSGIHQYFESSSRLIELPTESFKETPFPILKTHES